MQYLALIYGDESRWAGLSPEQREQEMGEYMALSQADVTKGGHELDSIATATTVRVRGDETLVTDGPFAETKEQIGGLMEIEAEDLDAAIAIASRIPVVRRASVELRPVIEH